MSGKPDGRFLHAEWEDKMSEAQEFRVSFENLFRRAEKKIAGPTVDLLGMILRNACLDEGEWVLKDSHRIKKKGRERFHAIRVESRAGAKSVRLWCKPRGNDSCFEYSLVPPQGISVEEVFKILRRVNPVSLEVPESPALPGAFLSHVIDVLPRISPPENVKIFEVNEMPPEPLEQPQDDFDADGEVREGEASERPSEALAEAPEGSFAFSMTLDEPCLLSDQEVMDKALVAMSLVADENGYIKKNDASNSVMEKLGIRNFVDNISGGTYTSVEGAMRALTMALTNRGNYIQKIHYPSGFNVRGYKLTAKAERRIKVLREKYLVGGVTPELRVADQEPNGATAPEIRAELERFDSGALDRLQSLISECKEAENHIKEVDSVIANLEAEISDLRIDLEALDLAEKERARQIEELTRDIGRIRSKKEPIVQAIEQKTRDKEEWERDKAPVLSKKSKAEIEIFGVTGRRRAN